MEYQTAINIRFRSIEHLDAWQENKLELLYRVQVQSVELIDFLAKNHFVLLLNVSILNL